MFLLLFFWTLFHGCLVSLSLWCGYAGLGQKEGNKKE